MTRLVPVVCLMLSGLLQLGPNKAASVWVHATVTDAQGHIVTDLTQKDFTVIDNGTERKITFFSRDELPVAISLMLDISGSMRETLPNVRRAAETLLDQFIPGDRVNVGTFDVQTSYSARFKAHRQTLLTEIAEGMLGAPILCEPMPSKPILPVKGLPRPGGTWMFDAIECGIRVLQTDGEAHRRVLILITDGMEHGGYASQSSARKMANDVCVLVYATGLMGLR